MTAVRGDELSLPAPSALLKRTVRFRVTFSAARFKPFLRIAFPGRRLGRVVCTEGRAREAETTPVEPAQLSVDHHLGRKRFAARFASSLLPRPRDLLAWSIKSAQRFAFQAVLAAVEINAPPVEDRVFLELDAACSARLHYRTLVLSPPDVKRRFANQVLVAIDEISSPGRIRTSNLLITRSPKVSLRRGLSHCLGTSLRCRHWALSL